jgi:hypothetical protein
MIAGLASAEGIRRSMRRPTGIRFHVARAGVLGSAPGPASIAFVA